MPEEKTVHPGKVFGGGPKPDDAPPPDPETNLPPDDPDGDSDDSENSAIKK